MNAFQKWLAIGFCAGVTAACGGGDATRQADSPVNGVPPTTQPPVTPPTDSPPTTTPPSTDPPPTTTPPTTTPPTTTPPATTPPTTTPTPSSGQPDLGTNASMNGLQVFPANDPWNQAIDAMPVDPNSSTILGKIGTSTSLHPDFGGNLGGEPFGIPYVVVPDSQARVPVTFDYADESDAGPYPIPPNPPIEPGGGDNHILMITRDEHKLYELYASRQTTGGAWEAGSGAIFDLQNGTQRPAGWTSADAAGLPIFPGLVRYDEVYERGQIDHALRFTVSKTRMAYLPPATHYASSSTDTALAPMGMRVRLKASFDISGFPARAQVILRALKKYGMMVADNGGNFYVSGTADSRWDDSVINTLKAVTVGDFEVVQMQGIVQ